MNATEMSAVCGKCGHERRYHGNALCWPENNGRTGNCICDIATFIPSATTSIHDPLPILIRTTTTYSVGCSCGWRYSDANEEWAEVQLKRHIDAHTRKGD